MNSLTILGKYLDQPALLNKMNSLMPVSLISIGAAYAIQDTFYAPKNEKSKKFVQNASVIAFTIASALIGTRGLKIKGKQLFEGLIEPIELDKECVEEVLGKVKDEKIKLLINKVKDNVLLSFREVKELDEGLNKIYNKSEKAISKVIPDAESEEDAFGELGKLSLLGLIPVVGGIAGGVLGDILTKDGWKKKFPNKIKEGSYQYLNNIFLCNVGAGIAMVIMNKLKVQNKTARFFAMIGGVVGVGVLAGSAIANFIGKNLIDPIFDRNKRLPKDFHSMISDLNSERHPEVLDLSLHIDDIASVGFLSGFKWIGPILPALYSISGYRAGIGYRNGEQDKK